MDGSHPKMLGRGALLPAKKTSTVADLVRGRGSLLPPSSSGGSVGLPAKMEPPQTSNLDPIDIEDPMKQAFEDEQNVYQDGPGARLPRTAQIPGKGGPGTVKLHVSNIPSSLSRTAVENIFSVHGNPTNIFIKEMPGNPTTWGFVEFATMSEAQTVISNISHQPPHHLTVKIAREKDAKESEIRLNQNGKEAMPKPAPNSRPPARMFGKNPQEQHSKVFNKDDTREPSTREYGVSAVAHIPSRIEGQNRAYFDEMGTNDTFGDKKLKNGGVVLTSKPPTDEEVHPNVVPYKEKCPSKMHLAPQLSSIGSGYCNNCDSVTCNLCTHCKMWFCCYHCIEAQWSEHKLICRPRRIVIGDKGRLTVEDMEPECSEGSIADKPINGNSLAEPKVPPSTKRSSLMAGTEEESGESVKSIESPEMKEPKKMMPLPTVRTVHVPYEVRTGYFKNSSGALVTDDTKDFEREVVVREAPVVDVQSQASVEVRHQVKKVHAEPPIPLGTFTLCTFLFSEPGNLCHYVCTSAQMEQMVEMMNELNEYIDQEGEQLKNFDVHTLCTSRYLGFWYRAKIVSIENAEKVKIYFIDFGNDEICKKTDLRIVPPKLAEIPPLAFRIQLSSEQSIELNTAIQISPVKELEDGSWLVRLEGDPEPIEEQSSKPENPAELSPQETEAAASNMTMEDQSGQEDCTKKQENPRGLSMSKFVKVTVMHREDPNILWVVTVGGLEALVELSETLEDYCEGQDRITHVEKHRVYAAIFSNIWCRVVILSTNPCTGTFIDYGNTVELNHDELRSIPTEVEGHPPLAIKVTLADGTPDKYFAPGHDSISIKVINRCETDNSFVAIVEGETYPAAVTSAGPQQITVVGSPKLSTQKKHVIEAVMFDAKAEVLITKTFGKNCVCGAIQLPGYPDCPLLQTISDRLLSAKREPGYQPALNDDVIVRIDDDHRLFRGYIMCIDGEAVGAALTDFGCVVKPIELWPLPAELKKLPSSAVRILFEEPLTLPEFPLIGKSFKLSEVLPAESALTARLGELGRVLIKPWSPFVEEAPILECQLPDKCDVVMTAFYSPSTLYVRPVLKECLEVLQEALQDVAAYGMSAEPLGREPICGELVAAQWSEDNQWYRGVVSKREGDKFRITFLDFGNDTLVGLDSMKGLPASYKKLPATVVKIGLKNLPYSVFNADATDMMNQFILQEIALVATHDGDLKNVELSVASSGEILNNLLAKKIAESRIKKLDSYYSVTDMRFDRWTPKKKVDVVTVGSTDYNEFYAVRQSPIFDYVCNILTPEITKYCEEGDNSPYAPRRYEMVLAKFEGAWYRALCTDYGIGQPAASITFVDFGNLGEQPVDEIRPMVHDFMTTPATARACVIYGLPPAESLTDEVKKKLMKSFNSITEIYVVEDEGILECVVWVPQLVNTFKSLGIPFTAPVGFSTT